MSIGKCFVGETKTAPTPTLQTSSLLSGPQYCHFAPSVFFCKGFRTAGIINGKKPVFCGSSSSLLLNDFQSCAFDVLDIPF